MNKLLPAFLICYLFAIAYIVIDVGQANETKALHNRQRRFLAFRNNTRFFLRFNFKANIIQWNQIFAQALGFRMNWNAPQETDHPYKHFYRRNVYQHTENLLGKFGLNGFHCIRRAICELQMIEDPTRIYHTILKIVFRRISSTERWHDMTTEKCEISKTTCPLSLLQVSTYTDI